MAVNSPTAPFRPLLGQEKAYYGKHNKLFNSMIDIALVYGIDENTCRGLDMQEKGSVQEVYSSLLQKDIKLRFLQVLAPGRVYPPRNHSPSGDSSTSGEVPKKFRMEDIGLAWETVDTLHFFVYPEGVQMYSESIEPTLLPLMLTNIEGSRSYAVGLKFARPFFIESVESGKSYQYRLTPWSYSGGSPPNCKLIYLPVCVVLVSPHPFYSSMKDALSGLYRLLSVDDQDINFWEVVHDFTEKMFLIPTLPEGILGLEVQLPGFASSSVIMPPRHKLYLDIRLDFPFRFLSVDDVLTVVAALLSEQRILIVSSQYTVPALFIQCLLSYIQPFEFRHPIVSILPREQLELLGAIGTNIMGCHSSALEMPEFGEVDEAVIVYLDEGRVECRLQPDFPLYPLPTAAAQRFKNQYHTLTKSMQYDIETIERLTLGSAVERERTRFYFHHYLDTKLLELFLELLVRLFSDLTDGLKESRAQFESKLKKRPESDQLFYKQVTQTDMFSVFLSKRRNDQRDCFTILADQIKLNEKKGSVQLEEPPLDGSMLFTKERRLSRIGTNSKPFYTLRNKSPFLSTDDRGTPPMALCLHGKVNFYRDIQFFEMPLFGEEPLNRVSYIESVMKVLEYLSQDKDNKPVCVYLSAYYKIALGDVMEGIDEFCETLKRLSSSLVPSTVEFFDFIHLLSPDEKTLIVEKKYYKELTQRRGTGGRHQTQSGMLRPSVGGKLIRRRPLMYADFLAEVKNESIARDAESASNLYSVLQTVGRSAAVSPDLFQTFLDSWNQVLEDNEKMSSEVSLWTVLNHEVQERVLAFGNDLKCNTAGHCTIVLTTHRILILSQAGLRDRTFAELFDLLPSSFHICEIALNFLGPKTPVIKQEVLTDPSMSKRSSAGNITNNKITWTNQRKNKSDPFLGFPNQLLREVWYRIIKEVISGWRIIFNRRDPSVMDEVECHVKMMIALYQTGLLEGGSNTYTKLVKIAQKLLSFHSKDITDNSEATDALQYRINPNIHQTEKATIESTLFIPTDICGGEGKIMLGMGNGSLRVYDMEAKCFESDLKIIDSRRRKPVRVTCLLLVDYHVWVGCLGRSIHILDMETLCCVSQLSFLDDDPRDLCLSQTEPKIVWTLLLNGVLLGFDPETRERVVKIEVPDIDTHSYCTCFTIWRDCLWVGTNRGMIAIMSAQDCSCVNQVFFPGAQRKQVEIKCLAVSSEDEIWCSVHTVPRAPDSTFLAVFNPRNGKRLYTYTCPDSNHRISCILPFKHTVWCGTKCGKIFVFAARTENNQKGPKVLDAHDDKIRSMAATDTDFVISGTGSNDGYANVWRLKDWFNDY